MFIGEVGQIMARRVEIHVVVVMAFAVSSEVVNTRHGNHSTEQIRSPEKQIGRVQRTQRCPGSNYGGIFTGFSFDEWHNLLLDVGIELLMANAFVHGVHLVIEPGFRVDAVDGKNFYFAAFNVRLNGFNQVKTLVFEVVGTSSRQQQKAETIVAVHGNFHVFVQIGAVPVVNFAVHELDFSYCVQ